MSITAWPSSRLIAGRDDEARGGPEGGVSAGAGAAHGGPEQRQVHQAGSGNAAAGGHGERPAAAHHGGPRGTREQGDDQSRGQRGRGDATAPNSSAM